MLKTIEFQNVLSKNRTEEYGDDVWEDFVIPSFYEKLRDLEYARKPRVIIGGRGCGKTMLLRYLSHQSTFSKKRSTIPNSEIEHIGLYWRVDTQFCSAMHQRGIDEDEWSSAFQHFVAIELSIELFKSLQSISTSSCCLFTEADLKKISFHEINVYDNDLPTDFDSLYKILKRKVKEFEIWLNNIKKLEPPLFYPGIKFILTLIEIVKSYSADISPAKFFVYLDEFENLKDFQKKVVNTWLKHSKEPLIFNLAMKKNSFEVRETTGPESLSHIHDYREHDLEQYLINDRFEVFASEILFLQLSKIKGFASPIDVSKLRSPEFLKTRKSKPYTKKILEAANSILPGLSVKELAAIVLSDRTMRSTLERKISDGIKFKRSGFKVENFISESYPEASIVNSALLFRTRFTVEEIFLEFNKLLENKENRYTNKTNWVHNNVIACIIALYIPFSRPCPFYSGVSTFCQLAKGNIRHFLELCHKSLNKIDLDVEPSCLFVSPEHQAEAAKETSTSLLSEIKSFGKYGNKLHTFVYRLGHIFLLAHQQPSQSEPERSHFSIIRGLVPLTDEDQYFLNEAVKWSVLIEDRNTKKKNETDIETKEYLLNPIYAPYFYISYRKKRRLELSVSDFQTLTKGSINDFSRLLNIFTSEWKMDIGSSEELPLLSLLSEK